MPEDGAMPRIYTPEEKIAFVTKVDELLRAGLSKRAAAEAAGTNWGSYTNWVRAGVRPVRRPAAPVLRTHEEKARLVAAVQALVEGGATVRVACDEVGVTEDRFFKWRKQLAPPPPMRPVEVDGGGAVMALVPVPPAPLALPASPAEAAEPPPPAGLSLVAPGGYRNEGLGVETAAALLRALV